MKSESIEFPILHSTAQHSSAQLSTANNTARSRLRVCAACGEYGALIFRLLTLRQRSVATALHCSGTTQRATF
jgi:hypothetical protein